MSTSLPSITRGLELTEDQQMIRDMVREFARNITSIRAEASGRKLRLTKLDKHSWRARAETYDRALQARWSCTAK